MRITRFSLAISLALASHSVLADSTVYGTFNTALESVSATGASAGPASNVRQTQRVTSNTSKIGFKGHEDLGNGLKALWQVEQEVSIDDGGARKGAWAGRNSFVGLEGGFGKVLLGNHDSAYKMFGYLVPLEDGSADFTGKDGLINRVSRLKNSVQYRSPELAGWLLGASYAADEARALTNTGQRSNGQVWSLAARYRQDALQTGVAFQRNGEQLSGSSLLANHQDFWKAMLRYTLGNTELGVGVEHERMDMAIGRDQRQTAWTAAVTQRLGAWTLGLAYVRLGSRQGADTATVKAADYQADQWALSASYGLSKRTQLYGFYTRLNNHAAATRNFDSSAINGVAAGANPSAVGLGISHQF